MFNATDMVGALMQNVLTGSSQSRIEHALSDRGLGQPGGVLAQLLGGATGSSGTGAGGMLGSLADMAKSMFGGAGSASGSGNPLAVGGLGALVGALLGGGGGAVKGALGGGAMALLGSLALEALQGQSHQPAGSAPAALPAELPLGLRTPSTMVEESELESKALLVLKAMINAAKADGQIDDTERQRILGKLEEGGADAEAREFVQAEMRRPFDVDGLPEAPDPQTAVAVYAASVLAIEVDTPAERDYLRRLAQGLRLEERTVQRVHAALGVVWGRLQGPVDFVGIVGDGRLLLEAARELRPDVIVADIAMPLLSGLEALRRLTAARLDAKVIFLTIHTAALVR